MTYAPDNRAYYDADSHIMELPNFLKEYADPHIREQVPEVSYAASSITDEEVAVLMARGGKHAEDHVSNMIKLGSDLIRGPKEIQALGAFNASERKHAMDILGFKRQLVFATHVFYCLFTPVPKPTLSFVMEQPVLTIAPWRTSVTMIIV